LHFAHEQPTGTADSLQIPQPQEHIVLVGIQNHSNPPHLFTSVNQWNTDFQSCPSTPAATVHPTTPTPWPLPLNRLRTTPTLTSTPRLPQRQYLLPPDIKVPASSHPVQAAQAQAVPSLDRQGLPRPDSTINHIQIISDPSPPSILQRTLSYPAPVVFTVRRLPLHPPCFLHPYRPQAHFGMGIRSPRAARFHIPTQQCTHHCDC
jgi:hypothetical protein